MHWYYEVFKKYAVFDGRARRKEYWLFTLFNLLMSLTLAGLDVEMGLASRSGYGLLSSLYSLVVFIPSLAVTVRRLHDTNRSGWWIFLSLIPCIGGIVLLVFLVEDSQPGDNQYGPDPKATTPWSSDNSYDPPQR